MPGRITPSPKKLSDLSGATASKMRSHSSRENRINELALRALMHAKTVGTDNTSMTRTTNRLTQELPKKIDLLSYLRYATLQEDLTVLALTDTEMTVEDYVLVGAVLANHPNVNTVDLRGNTLDKLTVNALCDVLRSNYHIVDVLVDDDRVPKHLFAMMEDCLVRNRQKCDAVYRKQWITRERENYNASIQAFCDHAEQFFLSQSRVRDRLEASEAMERHSLEAQFAREKKKTALRERQHRVTTIINEQCDWTVEKEVRFRAKIDSEEHDAAIEFAVEYEHAQRDVWIVLEQQERNAKRVQERKEWVLSRRAEKRRWSGEGMERDYMETVEGMLRQQITSIWISVWFRLTSPAVEEKEDALAREAIRVERERRDAQGRRRAEDLARERREREEQQSAAQQTRVKMEHRRDREKVELENGMVRKRINSDRAAFIRLLEGAAKVVHGMLVATIQYTKALQKWEQAVSVVATPELVCGESRSFYYGSWAPTELFPRGLFNAALTYTWAPDVAEADPLLTLAEHALDAAHKTALFDYTEFRDLPLEPVSDDETAEITALREDLLNHLKGILDRPVPKRHAPIPLEKGRAVKERILSGTIRVCCSSTAATAPGSESVASVPLDAFFVAVPPQWETEPPKCTPGTPMALEAPATPRRAAYSIGYQARQRRKTCVTPEEEAESAEAWLREYTSEQLRSDCPPQNDTIRIILPNFDEGNNSATRVTPEQITQTLRNLKYRYTGPGGATAWARSIDIHVSITVPKMLAYSSGEDAAVTVETTTVIESRLTIPMLIVPPVVFIATPLRFAEYELGTPEDGFVLFSGVRVSHAYNYSPRTGEVAPSPTGFDEWRLSVDIINWHPQDYVVLITNPAVCSATTEVLTKGTNIYFTYLGSSRLIAEVLRGVIFTPGTSKASNPASRCASFQLLLHSESCNTFTLRRFLSRLRFCSHARESVVGRREVALTLSDRSGSYCSTSVSVNVFSVQEPPEITLKCKKVPVRRHEIVSDAAAKFGERPYTFIAPDAVVENGEVENFVGGYLTVELLPPTVDAKVILMCRSVASKLDAGPGVALYSRREVLVNGVSVATVQCGLCTLPGAKLTYTDETDPSPTVLTLAFTEDGKCTIAAVQELLRCVAVSVAVGAPTDLSDHPVRITLQVGNSVRMGRDGQPILLVEHTQWSEPTIVDFALVVSQPLLSLNNVSFVEHVEGAPPLRLSMIEVRDDVLYGSDSFAGGFLLVEALEGVVAGDTLVLRKNEELTFKPRKSDRIPEELLAGLPLKAKTEAAQQPLLEWLRADTEKKLRRSDVEHYIGGAVKDILEGAYGAVGIAIVAPDMIFMSFFGFVASAIKKREILSLLKSIGFQAPKGTHSSMDKFLKVTVRDAVGNPSFCVLHIETLRTEGAPKIVSACQHTVTLRQGMSFGERHFGGVQLCPPTHTNIVPWTPQQQWGGGSLTVDIESGNHRYDTLRFMNAEQQADMRVANHAWLSAFPEVAPTLVAEYPALPSDWLLIHNEETHELVLTNCQPGEDVSPTSLDASRPSSMTLPPQSLFDSCWQSGEKFRVVLGTLTFPPLKATKGTRPQNCTNIRIDFYTPKSFLIDATVVRYCMACVTMHCPPQSSSGFHGLESPQTASLRLGARVCVVRLMEGASPASAKQRFTVNVIESPFELMGEKQLIYRRSFTRMFPLTQMLMTPSGLLTGSDRAVLTGGTLAFSITLPYVEEDTVSLTMDKSVYTVKDNIIYSSYDTVGEIAEAEKHRICIRFTSTCRAKLKHLQDVLRCFCYTPGDGGKGAGPDATPQSGSGIATPASISLTSTPRLLSTGPISTPRCSPYIEGLTPQAMTLEQPIVFERSEFLIAEPLTPEATTEMENGNEWPHDVAFDADDESRNDIGQRDELRPTLITTSGAYTPTERSETPRRRADDAADEPPSRSPRRKTMAANAMKPPPVLFRPRSGRVPRLSSPEEAPVELEGASLASPASRGSQVGGGWSRSSLTSTAVLCMTLTDLSTDPVCTQLPITFQ